MSSENKTMNVNATETGFKYTLYRFNSKTLLTESSSLIVAKNHFDSEKFVALCKTMKETGERMTVKNSVVDTDHSDLPFKSVNAYDCYIARLSDMYSCVSDSYARLAKRCGNALTGKQVKVTKTEQSVIDSVKNVLALFGIVPDDDMYRLFYAKVATFRKDKQTGKRSLMSSNAVKVPVGFQKFFEYMIATLASEEKIVTYSDLRERAKKERIAKAKARQAEKAEQNKAQAKTQTIANDNKAQADKILASKESTAA